MAVMDMLASVTKVIRKVSDAEGCVSSSYNPASSCVLTSASFTDVSHVVFGDKVALFVSVVCENNE